MAKTKKIKERRTQRQIKPTVVSKVKQTHKTKKDNTESNDGFRYAIHHTILLIGEGNFSFAHSIANRLGSGKNIVATALDSEATVKEKYVDAEDHIKEFRRLGGTVMFGIDGTKLNTYKQLRGKSFSHIVFNFPHTGSGDKDEARNVMLNQRLLLDFFNNARELLTDAIAASDPPISGSFDSDDDKYSSGSSDSKGDRKKRRIHWQNGSRKPNTNFMEFEGVQAQVTYDIDSDSDKEETTVPKQERGQVHVSLKSGKPYDMWKITKLARQCGLITLSAYPFKLTAYPGYEHRRTLGFKEGLSTDDNQEIRNKNPKVYVFAAALDKTKKDTNGGVRQNFSNTIKDRRQNLQNQEQQRKKRKLPK